MQNLAIFHESNKDAAYYRQQVSERGILEKIDALNGVLLKIEGATVEDLPQIYEVLNEVETSLNKNANDPRTRMALESFKQEPEKKPAKEPEKKPVVDTEEDLKNPDTENLKGTDPDGGVTGEPGSEGPAENTEGPANDTQEPTDEGTKEPTGEPDPAEKVDTTEPTDEGTKEPTSEPTGESTAENTEGPADETPEPKKGGRKKKDTE